MTTEPQLAPKPAYEFKGPVDRYSALRSNPPSEREREFARAQTAKVEAARRQKQLGAEKKAQGAIEGS